MGKRMNKWLHRGVVLAAALMLSITAGSAVNTVTAQAEETQAAVQEVSTKSGLLKEDGKYYFYKDGQKVKNTWKTIKKKTYYFGADGAAKTGWYTAKKGKKWATYYFTSKGVMKASKTQKIDKKLVKKMDERIKKAGVTAETEKVEALKLLFANMSSAEFNYKRGIIDPGKKLAAIEKLALSTLKSKKGNCVGFATAFAVTARRATGLPVRVCVGTSKALMGKSFTPHAWTEVKVNGKWLVFDTNAQRYTQLSQFKDNAEAFCGIARTKAYYKLKYSVNVNL